MPPPVLRFHPRVALLEPFLAMELMERAFELERQGRRILHLEIGEPDFPPPAEAIEACRRALEARETRYTGSLGLPELREAIAADVSVRAGVTVRPEQVLVTAGTSPAMLLVFALLAGPGDEVVLGTPHYPCYPNFIRFCGAEPILVRTEAGDGWIPDPERVARAVGPRTRAIVVASPANPTGAVIPPDVLEALAALGPPLVADHIYDGLVYGPTEAPSALRYSERAFVVDGFSKRYAMTGFRLGYAVVPDEALRPLQTMQQNLFICANRFVQHAGIAALRHGEATIRTARERFEVRRDRIVEGLRELGFGVPTVPEGAFYVLADARPFETDSRSLARRLLEEAGVAVTPGIDFGRAAEGWLRFSYAQPDSVLDEALDRLGAALRS